MCLHVRKVSAWFSVFNPILVAGKLNYYWAAFDFLTSAGAPGWFIEPTGLCFSINFQRSTINYRACSTALVSRRTTTLNSRGQVRFSLMAPAHSLARLADSRSLTRFESTMMRISRSACSAKGTKELVAVVDGVRESELSWKEVLLNLKSCGLEEAPELAIGDGALGFWRALRQAFPATCVENNFPFSVARDSVASARHGLTTRRGCEFSAGWNKHSAVPAEDMSIIIRIAGTALRLFQPTTGELKNSQTGCVVPLWGSNFRHDP